jgi:hypothetical protein
MQQKSLPPSLFSQNAIQELAFPLFAVAFAVAAWIGVKLSVANLESQNRHGLSRIDSPTPILPNAFMPE